MYLEQKDLVGNPFVGVFALTNDKVTLVPMTADDAFIKTAKTVLKTEVVRSVLCNSPLIGIFGITNNNGIVVPELAYKEEIAALKKFGEVVIVKDFNALGNMATANDNGCVASPLLSKGTVKVLEKGLGVKVKQMSLAGIETTGSCVAATNKGFLASSNISDAEFKALEKVFGVEGSTGSVNYGNPFVKSGLLVNSAGGIVGSTTTPFELGRIDDALFFKKG